MKINQSKISFSYLFTSLVCLLLASCEGDYDIGYHFTGLEGVHAENITGWPELSSRDSIPKERYVLRLNLFPVEDYRSGRYLDPETPPSNLNPINIILVTADNRYNDTLSAGEILNPMFKILNGNYLKTLTLDTSGQLGLTNVYANDFYDHPIPEHADLLMLFPPDSSRNYRFQIQVLLKDGTTFYDTTSVIRLY